MAISNLTQTLLFYGFALSAVLLAIAVVTTPLILRAAVYLMGVLGITAGFYLLLGMEFLAGVQVLVYVGGIVVLFVFAMMLTHSSALQEEKPKSHRRIFGLISALTFFGVTSVVILKTEFPIFIRGISEVSALPNDTPEIGKRLLDLSGQGYVLPFEVISLLLLSALVGGIVIARKTQAPGQEESHD